MKNVKTVREIISDHGDMPTEDLCLIVDGDVAAGNAGDCGKRQDVFNSRQSGLETSDVGQIPERNRWCCPEQADEAAKW